MIELEDTKKLLTPEMMDACNLENHIRELQGKENAINESINNANADLDEIKSKIDTKQKMLVDVEEQLLQGYSHIQTERDNKSVICRNVISFSVCLMKSWQATMKSSLRSDEIQSV